MTSYQAGSGDLDISHKSIKALMKLHELLGIPSIELIEPTFESLINEAYTDEILLETGTEAKLVINEKGWPALFALKSGENWRGCVFILRPPVVEVVEKFEDIDGDTVELDTETLMNSIREYYMDLLCQDVPPAIEDFSPDRASKVKELISEVWGNGAGEKCLDCGCGSGMGALILRDLGYSPVSYDNDASLLHLGIESGRLKADESICIDARYASFYVPNCKYGLALMAGSISTHTAYIWKDIIEELIEQCQNIIVTVESEQEAGIVKEWAELSGRKTKLMENERDGFYDHWVCLIS